MNNKNKIIEVAHVLAVLEGSEQFILEINPKFTKINGEPTLSNIGGKCEYLDTGILESGLECIIRETSEETGVDIKILKQLDFMHFGEVTRNIVGTIFRSEMYLVYFSETIFQTITQRENIWFGTLDDLNNSDLKCIIDKNEFSKQTKKWLDFGNT